MTKYILSKHMKPKRFAIQLCVELDTLKKIEEKAKEQDRTFSDMARILLKKSLGASE